MGNAAGRTFPNVIVNFLNEIFHGFGHLGDFIDTVAFVAFTVGRPASVNGRLVPMDFSIYFIPTHLIITKSVENAHRLKT